MEVMTPTGGSNGFVPFGSGKRSSLRAVAERCGLSLNAISLIERVKIRLPFPTPSRHRSECADYSFF